MKYFFIALVVSVCAGGVTHATNLEVSVTKISGNLYKIDDKDIFIQAENCAKSVSDKESFLRVNGESSEIIFRDSAGRCDVQASYEKSFDRLGTYAVIISRKNDNWYKISGTDSFIKTESCTGLVLGIKAILSVRSNGLGTLLINGEACVVVGVYTKIAVKSGQSVANAPDSLP